MDRRQFVAALTLLLVFCADLPLESESLSLTTAYPSPAGIYKRLISTEQAFFARDRGNVGIGTTSPRSPAPNGEADGNLEANDVFLRSTGKWLSQSGTLGSWQGGYARDVVYQAPGDGFVLASGRVDAGGYALCYTDSNSNPSTLRQVSTNYSAPGHGCAPGQDTTCMMPVKKGENWKVAFSRYSDCYSVIWFIPFN